jgi:hypothetical protein
MYENGKTKPVETILKMGRIKENDGGSEFNQIPKGTPNTII